MKLREDFRQGRWGPLLFGAVAIAFLAWRLSTLGSYGWTHDEGAYISAAWMVDKGYPLYHETVTSSPPLLIHWLAFFMWVMGPSVFAARLAILIYCTVGFVAVGLVAKELEGWPAALLAPLITI